MESRIYTREQKIKNWKQKGLLRTPKSDAQANLAFAARDFIEGLNCSFEVRRMLVEGRKPSEIARFILDERKERTSVSFQTVRKYAQAYRIFFIPPLAIARAYLENPSRGDPVVIRASLRGLTAKIEEIETLEKAMRIQNQRIKEQIEKERALGLPMPSIRLEMETFIKIAATLIDRKAELGYPGYEKVPHRLDLTARVGVARIDLLSPQEREALKEFGTTILSMIEAVRGQNTDN